MPSPIATPGSLTLDEVAQWLDPLSAAVSDTVHCERRVVAIALGKTEREMRDMERATVMVPFTLPESNIEYFPSDFVANVFRSDGYGYVNADKFVHPPSHLVWTPEAIRRMLEVTRKLVLACAHDPEWSGIAIRQQLIDRHFGQ